MTTISKIIIKIYIKITSRYMQDNHHHSLHNIFNDFKGIYPYRGSHIKIKDELYPWETGVITRETQKHEPYLFEDHKMKKKWKNKKNSRSCHHIALVTSFPTSQEFCNFDSVWKSYDNFSEDAQKFLLHKVSHFSPRFVKFQRDNWLMNK